MEHKKVSIIIPLYNGEDCIRSCLEGVFSQDYPRKQYEVIVVDNNSTDKSADIAREFGVTLLSLPEGNISSVRNFGASYATGEILGFVDSDCIVANDWIINAVKILDNNKVAATGSGYLCPKNATWVEKSWTIETKDDYRYVKFVTSGNFIVKSSVFKEINGFNENLETCEDADICERIVKMGYKIVNSAKIKNVHLNNHKSISQMFLKEIWYGKNMLNTLKNDPFDKVFIFTILFSLLHVQLLIALLITKYSLLFYSMISIFLLLIIATVNRILVSQKYRMLFNTMVLYYIYFLARSLSLLFNLTKKIKILIT